jgi:hypothetical protein
MSKAYNKKFSIKVAEKAKSFSSSGEFVRIKRKVLLKISRKPHKEQEVEKPKKIRFLDSIKNVLKGIRWSSAFHFFSRSKNIESELSRFEITQCSSAPIESQDTTSNDLNEANSFNLGLPLQL